MENIIIKQDAIGTKTATVDGVKFETEGLYLDMEHLLLTLLKENGINVYVETREGVLVDPITHKLVSEVYEIVYWNADHSGMRDLPTDSEIFEGTFEEAEARVRAKRSLWGHNYIPCVPGSDSNRCGNGVIHHISK